MTGFLLFFGGMVVCACAAAWVLPWWFLFVGAAVSMVGVVLIG